MTEFIFIFIIFDIDCVRNNSTHSMQILQLLKVLQSD